MQKSQLGFAGVMCAGMLLAAPAFADIAPIDQCEASNVGKACDNAGKNGDQAGTCEEDMCTRQTPSGSMTYECFVCVADTTPKAADKDDGGCSMAAAPAGGWAALVASLTALAFAAGRRRR